MFQIIMIGTMLFIELVLFATYHSAANARKNLRMSTTLPYRYLNEPEVMMIINSFKKRNIVLFLIFAVAALPSTLIEYTSVLMLYLIVWLCLVFIVSGSLYNRYNAKLIQLKSKNKWFPGEFEYHVLEREGDSKKNKAIALFRKWFPTTRDKLLNHATEPIYVDGDECWINGYYYNPEDGKTTVEKRFGIGTTVNLATKGGKWTIYGTFLFISVIIVPLLIMFFRMDFIPFQMIVGENEIMIDAPAYDYEFDPSDIKEVTLTQTLPKDGTRTNGAATSSYYLGNFRFDEYGSTKAYIYLEYPPYIVIRTEEKTILFNTKSADRTKEYYELLVKLIDQ